MTAIVKELNEVANALGKLKGFAKSAFPSGFWKKEARLSKELSMRGSCYVYLCWSESRSGKTAVTNETHRGCKFGPEEEEFSWLLRGYIKGGNSDDAAGTLIKMLDMALYPDYLDRVAVLHGLRNGIQQSGDVGVYLNVCKRLADAHLIGPSCVSAYEEAPTLDHENAVSVPDGTIMPLNAA